MSKLTKEQMAAIKLALEFLEDLSDKYGNAGCNDYSLENTDENWEIYKRGVYANGDSLEIQELEKSGRPSLKQNIETYDFSVVYACQLYLEDLLEEEIDNG